MKKLHLPKVKIAAYLRVSTKKQVDSKLGIEAQERQIKSWIMHQYPKSKYNTEVVYFKDEGISGATSNRHEFKRMLQLIENNYFDICVIYKIDRLTRDVGIASDFKEKIRKTKCTLVSISENFDLTTIEGAFVYNIQSVFGEHEREMIRKRTIDSQISKLLRKEYPYRMIFGYRRVNGSERIEYHPKEAKIVEFAFKNFVKIRRYNKLLDLIKLKFNVELNYCKLTGMLSRKEYFGVVTKFGIEYDGIFPPIITEELYENVQKLRESIKLIKREDKYMFQNRVVCFHCNQFCGRSMSLKNKIKRYFYYVCPCCKKYINILKLEKQLENIVTIKDIEKIDKDLQKNIRSKLSLYTRKQEKLAKDFVEEKITQEQYLELYVVIKSTIVSLSDELHKMKLPMFKDATRSERKWLVENYVDKIFFNYKKKKIEGITYIKRKK